jgi:large subunit ribosomal protein L24e
MKPSKLTWTQAWRRSHKKINQESTSKRRVRKVVKVATRAFVGLDAATLKEKRASVKPAAPKKAGEAVKQTHIAEAKAKAKAAQKERKTTTGAAKAPVAKSHAGRGR